MRRPPVPALPALALAAVLPAQHDTAAPPPRPMYEAPASDEAQKQIASFRLAPGLVCDLVAAEPMLCNPVAFALDGKGRCWVAETFRIGDGVFDTRSYMQWLDDDLACRTVADRLAKYRKHLAAELPKYDGYSERVRMLVDTDRDGRFDRSTVFADGFHDLADGIAAGVLPIGHDVLFACIPKLWRLTDRDGDGVAEQRTVVHDGYGVHTSLIGHDLHGLILGPDRRLYFSIGDRGFRIEQAGQVLDYPDEGAVLRCELDGSGLEVVHRGLRNPQELAFDAWGDLFTGDNNSDGGDRARFVQIVPGADSGWRIGYQWLSDRGAWNREKLWETRHPGQPEWVFAPLALVGDGPSGLVYDPGQGLPDRYRDCFFLCDFRGGASYSSVRALRLQRLGAGYELASMQQPIQGVLATDVDFGPDGSLYVSDWVDGWTKTGKGRLYRVRTEAMANDLALRNTAQLLAGDFAARPAAQLRTLLAHPDRRVRQGAEFGLVDQGARDVLADVAKQGENRLARVVALFGLGVLGRRDPGVLADVPALLADGDADLRATAARVLGDARVATAGPQLVAALRDGTGRVAREAALALARLGAAAPADAGAALLALLRRNDDHDPVLRHAAVYALVYNANGDALVAAGRDPSRAVRLGALLALARQGDARVAAFLTDADAGLRFEAARAIHAGPIAAALPALAKLAWNDVPDEVATDWRALNANRMLGEAEHGEALVHVAASAAHPTGTRREAIEILGEWPEPRGQDRVLGLWRPCRHEHPEPVVAAFAAAVPALLADPAVAVATARAAGRLHLSAAAAALAAAVADGARAAEARVAALDALDTMHAPELPTALAAVDAQAPVPLRRRAIELLSRTAPERAVPVLASLLANAPLAEQQSAFTALGGLHHPAAAAVLGEWLAKLAAGAVPPAMQLDVLLAAEANGDPALQQALAAQQATASAAGPLGAHLACREGGDPAAGRRIFFDNEATRCTRCHTLGGQGGNAGPVLDGVGTRRDRDYLLRALVTPSADIAEGFGATTLELTGDRTLVGVITRDQDGAVVIVGGDGQPVTVPNGEIRKRTPNAQSAMPVMAGPLDRRQLRDVLAFLASQR